MNRETAPISVVIPCFNAAATLRRSLESVLLQTVRPRQVIIVDDFSTDESAEVAEAFARDVADGLDMMIIRHVENRGAAAARNTGINNAKNPFIALLDSDDAWMPEKLEQQYSFMCSNPSVALSGHAVTFEHFSAHASTRSKTDTRQVDDRWKQVSRIQNLIRNNFPTPTVMFRADARVRFDERLRRCDDHLAWLECKHAGGGLYVSDEALTIIFKPLICGGSGLSSSLWKMELAELRAYAIAYEKSVISISEWVVLECWSIFKFAVRLIRLRLPLNG